MELSRRLLHCHGQLDYFCTIGEAPRPHHYQQTCPERQKEVVMKTKARLLQLGFLAFLLPMFFSCGSGSGPASNNLAEPVSLSLTEHNLTVSGGEAHQFVATVTGPSNTNVTWSLSGCTGATCGSISPTGLYAAPAIVPAELTVTVTAVAQADPGKTDQAAVRLMPIVVSISPADAWVAPGKTQVFGAFIQYDRLNAGVTWTLGPGCSDSCGTLSNVGPTSVRYTAPVTASGSSFMTLTATSVSNPSKKAQITITLAYGGAMTEGDYAFMFNGWAPMTNGWMYQIAAAGRFHADGQGNITQGVEDINSLSGVTQALPFTGDYSIGADGRGSFTFITSQGIATFRMVLDASKERGRFIRYDATQSNFPIFGSGYFELQDKAAFSLAALAGPYAFGAFDLELRVVGRFDAGASGGITGGSADVTQLERGGWEPQTTSANLELTGSFSPPSASTGRGTTTLNWGSPCNFAYYVISDQKILLVQIDARNSTTPYLSGEARRQKGPFSVASFSAPSIFSMAGAGISLAGWLVNAAVGQIIPDGSGSAGGVYDSSWGTTPDQPFAGSYTLASSGRSELQMKLASGDINTHVAYFYSPNEAFLMQTSGTDILFGRLKAQAAGPFSEGSLSGTYVTCTGPPAGDNAENACGLTTFDGSGGISSTVDVNIHGNLQHLDFDGTYTVAPNGHGTLIFSSPASGDAVFWAVSPTELMSAGAFTNSYKSYGTLLEYER